MGTDQPQGSLMRLTEIACYLRVSRQRAHQLAAGRAFPKPVERLQPGRVWERSVIEAWAEREWWGSRPWRKRVLKVRGLLKR